MPAPITSATPSTCAGACSGRERAAKTSAARRGRTFPRARGSTTPERTATAPRAGSARRPDTAASRYGPDREPPDRDVQHEEHVIVRQRADPAPHPETHDPAFALGQAVEQDAGRSGTRSARRTCPCRGCRDTRARAGSATVEMEKKNAPWVKHHDRDARARAQHVESEIAAPAHDAAARSESGAVAAVRWHGLVGESAHCKNGARATPGAL